MKDKWLVWAIHASFTLQVKEMPFRERLRLVLGGFWHTLWERPT